MAKRDDLISRAMRELAKRRTPVQAKATAAAGGKAAWASMTPEERSVEMKRRATKRKRKTQK
jgi:hypothetical protein